MSGVCLFFAVIPASCHGRDPSGLQQSRNEFSDDSLCLQTAWSKHPRHAQAASVLRWLALQNCVCFRFDPANCLNRNIQLVPSSDNSDILHVFTDAQAVSSVTGEASSPFHSIAFHMGSVNPSPRCRLKSQAQHNYI